jgi:hypothetical protein
MPHLVIKRFSSPSTLESCFTGDTPIVGAGTYANHLCAVSGTGRGEEFIKHTVAKEVAAIMEYKELPLGNAAREYGGLGCGLCLRRSGYGVQHSEYVPCKCTGRRRTHDWNLVNECTDHEL